MPTGQTSGFLRRLRRAMLLHDEAGLTNAELLTCFLERRDERAFEALLRRHGPMVLGVCRRLLGDTPDSEDAFQAAFLVFVRKAASIALPEALGGWLHGVAYRTALEARSRIARRRAKEKQMQQMPEPEVGPDQVWRELTPLLDRELNRLPDKYRLPVVLCDLEGRSRKEAARQLQIPEGTLSSRLATARKQLASRLARHGLGLSGGALAAALAAPPAPADVGAPLVASTSQAARLLAAGKTLAGVVGVPVLALTTGVLKSMRQARLRALALVVFAAGVVFGGVGLLARWTPVPGRIQAGPAAPRLQAALPAARSKVVTTWQTRATLNGHAGAVFSVAISPDGKVLAAGYGRGPNQGAVKLWDLATGKEKATLAARLRLPDTPVRPLSIVESVAFSSDGRLLLATTTTNRQAVVLWDTATLKQLPPHESYVLDTKCAAFGRKGNSLAGAKYYWKEGAGDRVVLSKLEIKVWDRATGRERASIAAAGAQVSTVAFSPADLTVAWADDALRLRDLATGRQRVLRRGREWIARATFSQDGKYLAAVVVQGNRGQVILWEVATGKELAHLRGHTGHVSAVAFSADGRTLATAGQDKTIKLWKVPGGQELATLRGHADWVLTVAFGRDGKTLVTGSQDNTVRLWQQVKRPVRD